MRVFVTGASGFIGSAVVQDLLKAGHQVVGLARSETSAQAIKAAGAQVLRGSLEDLESLRQGAAESDGVIHLGFIHDFSKFKENSEIDRRAIEAMGSVLAGSQRPLVVTSGVAHVVSGRVATEQDVRVPSPQLPRVSEETGIAMAKKGVRTSIIRLAPTVHGEGDHGFVPMVIGMAREKGVSAYIGEGQNRWAAVHRLDAATLFRLAFEKAAPEAMYHGVAEEGIEFKKIAEIIGKQLHLPVVSKSPAEAPEHFGWFTSFAGIDCATSSVITREQLGWKPTHLTLLEDLAQPYYFKK